MKAVLHCIALCLATFGQGASLQYFPPGSFNDSAKLSKFNEDWYSRELSNLEEPSLLETSKDKKAQAYRFLWLRSFRHPLSIRLEVLPDGTGLLTTKMANGADSREETKVILNEQLKMSEQQINWFFKGLQKQDFWNVKGFDHSQMGWDGATWIIEGVKDGKYHVVERWSSDDGPVHSLGTMLLRMSKL
jgi:hypothetical protein